MNLNDLKASMITPLLKGIPEAIGVIPASRIGEQKLGLLRQDVEFPVAILRQSALDHNRCWMRDFLERTGVLLAPHGKTTMSPELIEAQIEDGVWAITAATTAHIRVYHAYGVRRILHANQLVGRSNIDGVLRLLAADPHLDFYTLVDSHSGLALLREGLQRTPIGRPLQLLLEVGDEGGRTGVRKHEDAVALAQKVAEDPLFCLAGIECFEGIYSGRASHDDDLASLMVSGMANLALILRSERLFGIDEPIFSAGGSAYFDLVAREANRQLAQSGFRTILRSGCYLTHDSIHYRQIHERLGLDGASGGRDGLKAALEVWGCVQSRPEASLAIVNLGKRDISYDIDLPEALCTYRAGETAPQPVGDGVRVRALNDQHLFLTIPEASDLEVGDLVGFGISHPCTTFDKWRTLLVVDDDFEVKSLVHTFF